MLILKKKEDKWQSELKIWSPALINSLERKRLVKEKNKEKKWWNTFKMITCTRKMNVLKPSNTKKFLRQKKKKEKWRNALKKWSPVPVKSMFLNGPIPKSLIRQKKKKEEWRSALNELLPVPIKAIFQYSLTWKRLMRQKKEE